MKNWLASLKQEWAGAHWGVKVAYALLLVSQAPLLILILNRVFLPFDIDSTWYYHMQVIERVKNGGSPYVEPGPGYSATMYTPFYYYVSALVCGLLGSSMVWPRLVSLIATLAMCAALCAWTWRRTRRPWLALAAPLFVVSSWTWVETYWFQVHVDALHTGLAVLGFFALAGGVTLRSTLLSVVLLCLSAWTKQTGLAYVVAGCFYILLASRKLGLISVAVALAVLGGLSAWEIQTSHGLFLRSFMMTSEHKWHVERLFNEVLYPHLLGRYGIMAALTVLPLILAGMKKFWPSVLKPEVVMCGAGVAVACIAEPKEGSGASQALVAYAGVALCGSIGLHELLAFLPEARRSPALAWLLVLQMLTLNLPAVSEFRPRLVDRSDREAYGQVAEIFRNNRACYLFFGFLPTLFGQPDNGNYGDDSTMWENGQLVYDEPPEMNESFRRQEFDVVLLPGYVDRRDPTVAAILENYQAVGQIPRHPRGTHGGNARWEKYIFRAKRLLPPELPATNPTGG